MRTGLIIIRKHGASDSELAAGPQQPIDVQLRAIKELAGAGKTHGEIAEAQLWVSDAGVTKRLKFARPGETAPEPAPTPRKATPVARK